MHIIGYFAAALIGISLGLIGGGGSILTVPVLVYLFGTSPVLATSYSLFVVGTTSLAGAINYYRNGLVSFQTALLFGISSITTVFLTRKYLMPAVPDSFGDPGSFMVTKQVAIMVLFAVLMLFAALKMIKNPKNLSAQSNNTGTPQIGKLLLYGVLIGMVTGILGAGGGFLIIPTLVLLLNLPMKKAVGTSLLIIAMNSLIGFTGDVGHFEFDWILLVTITTIAIAGIFIGSALARNIEGAKLKKGFGWFVLSMSVFILVKEIIAG